MAVHDCHGMEVKGIKILLCDTTAVASAGERMLPAFVAINNVIPDITICKPRLK